MCRQEGIGHPADATKAGSSEGKRLPSSPLGRASTPPEVATSPFVPADAVEGGDRVTSVQVAECSGNLGDEVDVVHEVAEALASTTSGRTQS